LRIKKLLLPAIAIFSDEVTITDPKIIACLKYAPVASVDVELSFSIYKHIFRDRRQLFKLTNLEKHMIVNVNQVLLLIYN